MAPVSMLPAVHYLLAKRVASICLRCGQLLVLTVISILLQDIKLFINSPGGSVTAGMGIYDAMQVRLLSCRYRTCSLKGCNKV